MTLIRQLAQQWGEFSWLAVWVLAVVWGLSVVMLGLIVKWLVMRKESK